MFLHFGAAQEVMTRENTIRNVEKRSVEWFNLSAILGLSSLTSHTCHQAARSSPRWRLPGLEFLASSDQNFKISLSNLPLYYLFVGEKKKTAVLEKTSPLKGLLCLGIKEAFHNDEVPIFSGCSQIRVSDCINLKFCFSSYRCGNSFCATHRYAEAHSCTYDYKSEGRKIIEQNNPVIAAPKLPKI